MAFSDEIIKKSWIRAKGKCECKRTSHGHSGRCSKMLLLENRGRDGWGAWEANHINRQESGGGDGLSNCEILCWNCHKKTF